MKERNGFVSNSSSCSFILDFSAYDKSISLSDWFSFKNLSEDEKSFLCSFIEALPEGKKEAEKILFDREVITSDWQETAEDDEDFFIDAREYEKREALRKILNGSLKVFEAGNLNMYHCYPIPSELEEKLSILDKAEKIFTKHAIVFSNYS